MTKFMTIHAYAKHRGVDHRAIRGHIESGNISPKCLYKQANGKYLIDPDAADLELEFLPDVRRKPLPASAPPPVPKPEKTTVEVEGQTVEATVFPTQAQNQFERYRDAKTTAEQQRARKLELEVAEKEGRLLDADEVKKRITKLVSETKDAILNVPARLAPILVSITDPVEMETKLLLELNGALASLARLQE